MTNRFETPKICIPTTDFSSHSNRGNSGPVNMNNLKKLVLNGGGGTTQRLESIVLNKLAEEQFTRNKK